MLFVVHVVGSLCYLTGGSRYFAYKEITAAAEGIELSDVGSVLGDTVTVLARLVDRCSDRLAEAAQPKVTQVLNLLVSMATPMIDSINTNAQEAGTTKENLGGEEDKDEYKIIFDQNKKALEENVRILNRSTLSNYIVM